MTIFIKKKIEKIYFKNFNLIFFKIVNKKNKYLFTTIFHKKKKLDKN